MPSRKTDLATQLARIDVLRELSAEPRALLARHCRTIAVTPGDVIYCVGDPPGIHAVLRGRVMLIMQPTAGAEVEVASRSAGHLFGELSLLLGRHNGAAVVAEPGLIGTFSRDVFRRTVHESAQARDALMVLVAEDAVQAEIRMSETVLTVQDRLQRLLKHLAAEVGIADSRGTLLQGRFGHEELARMLGVGRVAVTRALSALRREGRIIIDRRLIILRPR